MKYVQIETADPVIDHAVKVLSEHLLLGERVTWLLSGGSAIDLEVRIAQALQLLDVSRLTVGLIDERYGPIGHENENYLQLQSAHFPLPMNRVLIGDSPARTVEEFGSFMTRALDEADFSLGIFGIGADGHTAGIKSGSPAANSAEPAVFYEWSDFRRITITPASIRRLDEAIISAAGSEKTATLKKLVHEETSISEQPAQVLKELKRSTLYTDNTL